MKASILAHGLMQNLVVTADAKGGYRVIAGSRRLEALRALQAEGKLPGDHAVPCQVASDEHALEMSLAENTVRLAMHPADEFEAFGVAVANGPKTTLSRLTDLLVARSPQNSASWRHRPRPALRPETRGSRSVSGL